ncbi:MAG: DUF3159 domain-containing protein [Actinomycetales bacterium]|nr:DUF3159 domain-containing protein [Actinomycetales bacterium]
MNPDPDEEARVPAVPAAPPVPAVGSRGIGQLAAAEFDFMEAVGGWRGLVESIAPGLVFVIVFLATGDLVPALVAAGSLAVLAVLVRLAQRTPLTQAFGGLFGVAISVVWAWQSGEAANFFQWGLWVNAAYLLGCLVSILARWPVVGVLVALIRGTWEGWRESPMFRRYVLATWLWVALFAARLLVQVPLFRADDVAWLGTAKLVMGVPLFGLVVWLTWLMVREPAEPEPPRGSPPH